MSAGNETQPKTSLALPAPPGEEEVEQLIVNGTQTFKFDRLGPIVVNTDGSLSRVANWEHTTPTEKERILRVLVARNKVRLANQEKQQGEAREQDKLSISNSTDQS